MLKGIKLIKVFHLLHKKYWSEIYNVAEKRAKRYKTESPKIGMHWGETSIYNIKKKVKQKLFPNIRIYNNCFACCGAGKTKHVLSREPDCDYCFLKNIGSCIELNSHWYRITEARTTKKALPYIAAIRDAELRNLNKEHIKHISNNLLPLYKKLKVKVLK